MNQIQLQNRGLNIRGWYIVFINAFVGCGIASSFPQFSMTIARLSEYSGISQGILMTSDTVKSVGIVASMLISGFAYNRFGARRVFLYALVVTVLPQMVMPHVSSVFLLMVLKIIQGTASIVFPVFLVIILNWIEEKDAGLSTAIFNGIFYAGGGIGGTVAGIVIARYDWIASYYALGGIQIALGIIWLISVKESPSGTVKADAKTESESESITGTESKLQAAGREDHTLDGEEKNLMKSPTLWLLAACFFATTWSVQAVTVDLALFGEWLGYGDIALSKIMSAVTAGMIISCVLSGKISDFFARRSQRKDRMRVLVLMAGQILIVASVCMLVLADMQNFRLFYAATFLFTFAGSWGLGTFYSILPEIYAEKEVPVVTGITGGIGDMGMPIAPLVVGVFFGLRGFWNVGWASCAAMALISFLAGLALLYTLNKNPSHPAGDGNSVFL